MRRKGHCPSRHGGVLLWVRCSTSCVHSPTMVCWMQNIGRGWAAVLYLADSEHKNLDLARDSVVPDRFARFLKCHVCCILHYRLLSSVCKTQSTKIKLNMSLSSTGISNILLPEFSKLSDNLILEWRYHIHWGNNATQENITGLIFPPIFPRKALRFICRF